MAGANSVFSQSVLTPIIITKRLPSNKLPRNLQATIIDATYYDKYIYLTFYEDLGQIYVQVTNTSSGNTVSETADSGVGQIAIDISGIILSGNFCIYIIPLNNTQDIYEGSFQL